MSILLFDCYFCYYFFIFKSLFDGLSETFVKFFIGGFGAYLNSDIFIFCFCFGIS